MHGKCRVTGGAAGAFLRGEDVILDHFVVEPWPRNREALGVTGEARRFDAVIMGRRTYQPALDMGLSDGAYPHVTQYVVSHQPLPASSSVQWVDRDPAGFIVDLKRQSGKDIWLCGGGSRFASNSGLP